MKILKNMIFWETYFKLLCQAKENSINITLVAGVARSQYPGGPATGHLGTDFSCFPVSVYKRMLRWFPRLQVATAFFSCSPSDLNFLDP
jgi:hypothetical protein